MSERKKNTQKKNHPQDAEIRLSFAKRKALQNSSVEVDVSRFDRTRRLKRGKVEWGSARKPRMGRHEDRRHGGPSYK